MSTPIKRRENLLNSCTIPESPILPTKGPLLVDLNVEMNSDSSLSEPPLSPHGR